MEGGSRRTSCFGVSFLPGNSRVDARINYWFNGSMTKNVKGGLEAEKAARRGAGAQISLASNETDL